jgi:hypothetical protein
VWTAASSRDNRVKKEPSRWHSATHRHVNLVGLNWRIMDGRKVSAVNGSRLSPNDKCALFII